MMTGHVPCAGVWNGINPIVAETPMLTGKAKQSQEMADDGIRGRLQCSNGRTAVTHVAMRTLMGDHQMAVGAGAPMDWLDGRNQAKMKVER
jgi:hypothetical protein